MRAKKISLIFFVTLSCVGIALLPVLIYTLLSLFIFGKGLDTITKSNLLKYTHEYVEMKNFSLEDDNMGNIVVFKDYEQIPIKIKNALPKIIKNGELYKSEISTDDNSRILYCLLATEVNGHTYYAFQKIPVQEADAAIRPQAIQTIYILLGTGGLILVILLAIISFIIKNISRPIYTISSWTKNLTAENVNESLPNLVYPELYDIARLIQKNLAREYDRLKREELFWRYCSHELRTPVSVVGVGVELLQKKVDKNIFNAGDYNDILKRLRRSTYSMSYLIESILWTGNPSQKLTSQSFDLASLINEVINDLEKIYFTENVDIKMVTSSCSLEAPTIAVRIVLENIIRNAIQHSNGSQIEIYQNRGIVKVVNKILPVNGLEENIGFGLGLELIERLTTRLGWEVKILNDNEHNLVIVKFN